MRALTCWRLRRSMTRYADGELAVTERGAVDRHLETCQACQKRVRIERAVGQSLRHRTARAGSTAWLTRPELPMRGSMSGWRRAALVAGVVVILAFWSSHWFGAVPIEAVGVISDSHCNGVHRPPEAPGVTPRDCIRGCIRRGAHYVFVAGDTIYTIRNPGFMDLMASAGGTVRVSGTARGAQLTLAHIGAVDTAR